MAACVAASLGALGVATTLRGRGADDVGAAAALDEAMRMEDVDAHLKDPRSADQDIDDFAGVDDGIDFQVSDQIRDGRSGQAPGSLEALHASREHQSLLNRLSPNSSLNKRPSSLPFPPPPNL